MVITAEAGLFIAEQNLKLARRHCINYRDYPKYRLYINQLEASVREWKERVESARETDVNKPKGGSGPCLN